MKKIRLHTIRIKNNLYFKIPKIVTDNYKLSDNENMEITIHDRDTSKQSELWGIHPEDLNTIEFLISDEVHTMNMYNRIYIPEKFRFFFPLFNKDFILLSNSGNIKTHLSNNGYIAKGMRYWLSLNGPLLPKDKIIISVINEDKSQYELIYQKIKQDNTKL